MGDPKYFDQTTYWSVKWYNLMAVNIVIMLFYALILPVQYMLYVVMFFTASWLFYVINYLDLREKKKKEKKDESEKSNKQCNQENR